MGGGRKLNGRISEMEIVQQSTKSHTKGEKEMKKKKFSSLAARLANKPLSLHKQILKHVNTVVGQHYEEGE